MEQTNDSNEILTERDLVAAWVAMLNVRNADYCDVDLDELNYQLMLETRIHYSLLDVKHPLKEMLTHFGRTKWQWLRLEKRVKAERKAAKNG